MDVMELGAVGELVGGLAVIASLIYVGLQVRQNTRAQNIAAGDATVNNLMEAQNLIAGDPDLSRIVMAGGLDPSSMPLEDRFRFNLVARTMFIQFDIAREKREEGLLSASVWHTASAFFDGTIRAAGIQQWWKKNASQFSSELNFLIEARIRSFNEEVSGDSQSIGE